MSHADDPDHKLAKAARIRQRRRETWEREGERSIARNLAMIGALGWTIVVPTLLGLFVGRWLDSEFATGLFWTLGLLVLGLAMGCRLAWSRMHHE